MRKFLTAMTLVVACLLVTNISGNASDGVVIDGKPAPSVTTPTPTPTGGTTGRTSTQETDVQSDDDLIQNVWDFLAYLGL